MGKIFICQTSDGRYFSLTQNSTVFFDSNNNNISDLLRFCNQFNFLFSLTSEHLIHNWTTFMEFLKLYFESEISDFLEEFLKDYLKSKKAEHLDFFIGLMSKFNLQNFKEKFEQQKNELIMEIENSRSNDQEQLIQKNLELLNLDRSIFNIGDSFISNINLSQRSALVIRDLGSEIHIDELYQKRIFEERGFKFFLHKTVKECFFGRKNPKISKNEIKKALQDLEKLACVENFINEHLNYQICQNIKSEIEKYKNNTKQNPDKVSNFFKDNVFLTDENYVSYEPDGTRIISIFNDRSFIQNEFNNIHNAELKMQSETSKSKITKLQSSINKSYEDISTKMDSIKNENLDFFEEYLKFRNKPSIPVKRLDPWQISMIENIKENKSVFVNTPTGSGKTYASFFVYNHFVKQNENLKIVYCAPNFHLAFQTYCNFKKTFESKKCTFVSKEIFDYNNDSTVFIGTPAELLQFFTFNNIRFNIGIFDEIHNLSLSYSDSEDMRFVSESLLKLLELFTNNPKEKKQLLALSATVNSSEINVLIDILKNRSGINSIEIVSSTVRNVPLNRYIFDGDRALPVDPITSVPEVGINENSIFNILSYIQDNKHLPVIVFFPTDLECYNTFKEYVDRIENLDFQEMKLWYHIQGDLSQKVESYNETKDLQDTIDSINLRTSKRGKVQSILDKKQNCLFEIKTLFESKISKYYIDWKNNLIQYTRFTQLENKNKLKLESILSREITDLELPYDITAVLEEYSRFLEYNNNFVSRDEDIEIIPYFCDGISRFFKIGDTVNSISIFEAMKNRGNDLLTDEGLSGSSISGLLDLIIRGLKFGVSFLIPSLPFAIQKTLIQIMNTTGNKVPGSIKCTFTSKSMSQGINYAYRSAVIINRQLGPMNVCEFRQMEGRCGRRGFDTEGHVYAVNISNIFNMSVNDLGRIIIPQNTIHSGFYLTEPELTCSEIEKYRSQSSLPKVPDLSLSYQIPFDITLINNCIVYICIKLGIPEDIKFEIINLLNGVFNRNFTASQNQYLIIVWVNRIKTCFQEMYVRKNKCKNSNFLEFIKNLYKMLHQFQFIQIRN